MLKFLFAFIFISISSFADESALKTLNPAHKKMKRVSSNYNTKRNEKKTSSGSSPFENLERQNEILISQLGQYQSNPAVWDFTNEYNLSTGSTVYGILQNSVVSTNLESPILVKVKSSQKLPEGSLLSCVGVTKHKRVMAACNRLVLPDSDIEYEIQVSLLNTDGSSGIKADYYYTGKEEYVAATVASSFARGIIELQTDRLATPLGQLTTNTSKNRLLNGVLGSTDEMNNLMRSEMQNKEPKAYIKAGKEVIVYFHERFKI